MGQWPLFGEVFNDDTKPLTEVRLCGRAIFPGKCRSQGDVIDEINKAAITRKGSVEIILQNCDKKFVFCSAPIITGGQNSPCNCLPITDDVAKSCTTDFIADYTITAHDVADPVERTSKIQDRRAFRIFYQGMKDQEILVLNGNKAKKGIRIILNVASSNAVYRYYLANPDDFMRWV